MKPVIILEGMEDVAILRAILPPDLVETCEFLPVGGRSTLVSVARTHLIKHHAPIAILLDTDTMNPTAIAETVQTTRHLLHSVAGDTPFEVVYSVPTIETVIFQGSIDFGRIFPLFGAFFLKPFAATQPKEQLAVLFEKAGGPRDLPAFLNELTHEEVESLRTKYPIAQLISFISTNLASPAV